MAFIVGIDSYEDPEIASLHYASEDARAFAKVVSDHCGGPDDHVRLFTTSAEIASARPTRSNILRELRNLTQLGRPERCFFFFSGHGFQSSVDGRDYLVVEDTVAAVLEDTSLPFTTVTGQFIQAGTDHLFMFVDACRAVTHAGKGVATGWLAMDIAQDVAPGVAVFASCAPGHRSFEVDELKRGLFTEALIGAISDDAKCATVSELDAYLQQRLPSLSVAYGRPVQRPYTRTEPLSMKDAVFVSPSTWQQWRAHAKVGNEVVRGCARTDTPIPRTKLPDQRTLYCGIDFGTSHSSIGYTDESGQLRLAPASDGSTLVPSAVGMLANGNYVVGREALELEYIRPGSTVTGVKRLLGSDKVIALGGQSVSAEFVASLIIRSLRRNFEELTGSKADQALVSIPANFNIRQSRALANACALAGLNVYRMIGEPCAAAVALEEDLSRWHNRTTLVLDLGGGTFDVSVLEIGDGVFEVRGVAGDNHLGGIDFDDLLAVYAAGVVETQAGVGMKSHHVTQLRHETERAKIALTSHESAQIIVSEMQTAAGFEDIQIPINRADFRRVTRPLTERISRCIARALILAGCEAKDIDLVMMAGQGCKIFTVKEIVGEMFVKAQFITRFQENAVVQGLCRYSGVLSGINKQSLVLDSNYTTVALRCAVKEPASPSRQYESVAAVLRREKSPRSSEFDATIAADAKRNTELFSLMAAGETIPVIHVFDFALVPGHPGEMRLDLIEIGSDESAPSVDIGIVTLTVDHADTDIAVLIEADANRTIVLKIAVHSARVVHQYQVNNQFAKAYISTLLPDRGGGYEVLPLKLIELAP